MDDSRDLELDRLRAGPEPPPGLEEATVEHLRTYGALAARGRWRRVAALVAILGWFGVGVWIGRASAPRGDYILLLRESAANPVETVGSAEAVYAQYGRWARSRPVVMGERLGDEVRRVGGPLEGEEVVSGYFVVSASSMDKALEIAEDCPHVLLGGAIEVRRLDDGS